MLVNFEKETINLSNLLKNEKSILLVEGDIIVPDRNPDIEKILLTDAGSRIMGKEYDNSKVNVWGNVFVNILYTPQRSAEDSLKLKSINSILDFNDSFDCVCENPEISVKSKVLAVDYKLINSRKVNVKITVELCTKVYVKNQTMLVTNLMPQTDAEVKKQSISIHSTAVDCQKEFVFTEKAEVPAAKCDIEEILKSNVSISKGECKTGENKISLSGSVNISTLYSGFEEDYIYECMEHEFPFYQEIEAEGLFPDCMCNVTYDIKDVDMQIAADENGDPRIVEINVKICANITASRNYDMDILNDLYFPGKMCNLKKEKMNFRKNVNEGQSRVSLKNVMTINEENSQIYRVSSVTSHPVIRSCEMIEKNLVLKGDITAFIVYSDKNGELFSESAEFLFEHTIEIDEAGENALCEYDIAVTGVNFNILSEKEVEIRTNVEFYIRMTEEFETDVICECEVTEITEDMSLIPQIIVYFVQKGDTLWDIAKHYNTTVKRIMEANHKNDDINPGEKLLIPAR